VFGLVAGAAQAQTLRPSVALHISDLVAKNACEAPPDSMCGEIVTADPDGVDPGGGSAGLHNVYMVVLPDENGIRAMEAGIWYEFFETNAGIKVFQWNLCADQEFASPTWPDPDGYNTIVWTSCVGDPSHFRVAGYFYMGAYSPSLMQLTPRANNGLYTIANCEGAERALTWPDNAGWVSFGDRVGDGSSLGCNPCLEPCTSVPVDRRTWGGIKRAFGSGE
jgi:hypothetical protein